MLNVLRWADYFQHRLENGLAVRRRDECWSVGLVRCGGGCDDGCVVSSRGGGLMRRWLSGSVSQLSWRARCWQGLRWRRSGNSGSPGVAGLPAVQVTVRDACTGAGLSDATVSISDPSLASQLAEEQGIFYFFKHTDGSHALLHVADPGHVPLSWSPALDPNPGAWLFRPGNDFGLGLSPAAGSVVAGGTVSSSVLTSLVQGSPESIACP